MKKKYLNKKDVSRMTGFSISTLNKWILKRKNIPFIKAGWKILYDPADIEAFMNENKVTVN